MSLDFLTRPIGGKKTAEPETAAPRERRRGGSPNPEDVHRPGTLTIGGSPRVDLMPPEIRVKRSQLRTRRSLRLGLFAVAGVVVLACGATVALSTVASAGLLDAQARETTLLQQQNQFADVKSAVQSIQLIEAGQQVGASTEIDWSTYLGSVRGLLPAGVDIDTATIDQATPVAPYTQTLAPLQGKRVGTLTVITKSPDIPPVAQILASMEKLPGFVDVSPATVVWDEGSRSYKATITLHIDEKAFDGRFQPTASPAPTAGGNG
jgi:Tfp pilus assembly protein PilN